MAEATGRRPRRIDPGGVFWALVFAVVALTGITGNGRWLLQTSAWWIAAAVIAVLGVLLVVFSSPGGRDRGR